jgi:hypothetical protein
MKKRLKYILAILTGLCLLLAFIFLSSMDERGLESHVRQTAEKKGIILRAVTCSMNNKNGRSRRGLCQFPADPALFERFKAALEFQEHQAESQEYFFSEGCAEQAWIKNPAYEQAFPEGERALPFRGEVMEYLSSKWEPMPGNGSSSFIRAFYNKAENKVCIDLHYPYG